MGIFDDIGKFLDDAFGVQTNQNPLHGLKKGTPLRTGGSLPDDPFGSVNAYKSPITGIENSDPSTPQIWGRTKTQSTEALSSVFQNRERPFTVIDVVPFSCDAINFFPLPSLNALNEKIGNQGDELSQVGPALSFNSWRSVVIQVPGTYCQIKFLPTRVNSFQSSLDSQPGAAVANPNGSAYSKAPNSFTANVFGSGFITRPVDNANRIILAQFEDSGAPLINCEHGETFKCAFTTVILTFKVSCPRFSVIIGNGAELDTHNDNRAINSDLAMGPGTGLWENPIRHATPFCITEQDNNPSAANGSVASGGTVTYTIFQATTKLVGNGITAFLGQGTTVGWITGINLVLQLGGSTNSQGVFYIFAQSPGGNNGNKLICSVPWFITATAGSGLVPVNIYIQYSVPRRFVLSSAKGNSGTPALIGKISHVANVGAIACAFKYTIEGYIYGNYYSTAQAASPAFNYMTDMVTTDPFPLDYLSSTNNNPS